MNDTISRQVAIDALTDKNIIEHLDSVYDSELHRFKRATERIIAQLPSAQRWIPCSERLPEDFQKVLVFWWEHSEPMIDTAFWQKDAKRFDGQHWVRMEDKVTHWMPLPGPPAFNETEE